EVGWIKDAHSRHVEADGAALEMPFVGLGTEAADIVAVDAAHRGGEIFPAFDRRSVRLFCRGSGTSSDIGGFVGLLTGAVEKQCGHERDCAGFHQPSPELDWCAIG